jgi:hypothetical protein
VEGPKEEDTMKTVRVYEDTSKPVGDPHRVLVSTDQNSANAWFKEFDPEGVAFEYPVIGKEAANSSGPTRRRWLKFILS